MAAFTVDIIIQFLTSYINVSSGDEIMKPSMIARRYLAGEFTIDFISTFPFRYFLKKHQKFQTFASVCQLLKVFRIRKLYSMLSHANMTVEGKALAKIAFLTFILIIYTHIIACVMWFSLKTEYLWVAPTDFGNIRSRLFDPWYETGYATEGNLYEVVDEIRTEFDIFIF